jgi:predicted nuclease of predicted toxin-antitoxin system
MSRPRYLADHDLSDILVRGVLRKEPAIEFVRAREVELQEASDNDVLAFAAQNRLIVVSHDMNTMAKTGFARLRAGEPLAGLLLVSQDAQIRNSIEELILIWAVSEAEEWENQVRFLPL